MDHPTLIHIEKIDEDNMKIQFKGEVDLLSRAIATAMQKDTTVAQTIASAVRIYAIEKGISPRDLF